MGQIMKIDQFLGLNRGKELCEKIAEACKFTNLKAAKDALVPPEKRDALWNKDFGGFYRKGALFVVIVFLVFPVVFPFCRIPSFTSLLLLDITIIITI